MGIRVFIMDYNLRDQLGISSLRDLNRAEGLAESTCISQSRRNLL
jgi:hypothetical protein